MLNPDIKVSKSNIQGKGLFARRLIKKGTLVCTLDGTEKQLTLEQLNKLPKSKRILFYEHNGKWIICTDGSEYMNHNCNPNTWGDGTDETLIARRNIKPGEEVTYDYSTAEIDERFRAKWICNCKSKNCRKVISGDDCLNPKFQRKYKGHITSWVEEYIRKNNKR